MAVEKLGLALKDVFENPEHPNHVKITQANVKEVIMTLMVDIPLSILGMDTNLIPILSDASMEYHTRVVNDSLEYAANNPEEVLAAIEDFNKKAAETEMEVIQEEVKSE